VKERGSPPPPPGVHAQISPPASPLPAQSMMWSADLMDVEVVLDDDHRVPRVREQVEDGEQFRDVVEVEPVVGSSSR